MRALRARRATRLAALAMGVAGALAPSRAVASGAGYPPVAQAPMREDTTTFAPAVGAEVGIGVVSPSFGAPVMNLLGHVGVSLSLRSNVSLSVGGETGLALSFSDASPTFGYLLRIPLRFFGEGVFSKGLDYRTHKYMNLHLGGTVGDDFALASQCAGGTCSYVPASLYTAFGLRVGLSYSQYTRNAVGIFMRWDNEVAQCHGLTCNAYIQTYIWDLGWTLF